MKRQASRLCVCSYKILLQYFGRFKDIFPTICNLPSFPLGETVYFQTQLYIALSDLTCSLSTAVKAKSHLYLTA